MQIWACRLLKLKVLPNQFQVKDLKMDQVQVLGLKLKFEFDYFEQV